MANVYEIPLQPSSQSLTITINGNTYNLVLTWRYDAFILDIYNAGNVPLVTGIRVVTGCDLLAQFKYLNFGFQLVVISDGDPTLIPVVGTLGVSSHLCAVY